LFRARRSLGTGTGDAVIRREHQISSPRPGVPGRSDGRGILQALHFLVFHLGSRGVRGGAPAAGPFRSGRGGVRA
jgi:hypothetical protein